MFAVALDFVDFVYPKAKKPSLKNISLQIPEGSFFALLGENGAGKTTLMRLVCGRLQATSGNVEIAESLRCGRSVDLKKIGALIENPGDYPRLTVEEYLTFFGKLYEVGNLRNRIHEVLDKLNFEMDLGMRVGSLSLGNRQKLQIARAVLHSPKILLLDEPAANLDPVAREALWMALSRYREETNCTLVVSSHILPELDLYATNFAILKKGEVALQGEIPKADKLMPVRIAQKDYERALDALKNAGIEVSSGESHLTTLYKRAMQ